MASGQSLWTHYSAVHVMLFTFELSALERAMKVSLY